MKTNMAFALALALVGAAQAAPPQRVVVAPSKVRVNANPAARPANTSVAPAPNAAGNTAASAASNNLVCPRGINPQQAGAAGQCFPRPTRNVQK